MKNSRIVKLIGIGLLAIGMFGNALGQSGGANTPQNKNTDNGSDQNLKSSVRVNPSTLAMEMSLPLANYPGRNGSSLPVGISYSSKLWRMEDSEPYFYTTPIGNYRQYVTQLYSTFAERSAAGWTSSIAFPVIEEKLEIFTQEGDIFNFALYRSAFNERAAAILNASNQTPDNAQAPGDNCRRCSFGMVTASGEIDCLSWHYWNSGSDSCGGGGGGGGGGCGTWCDIEPVIPNNQPPPKMHYVKRVHVRMGDGSTTEFRKSDTGFGYCLGGNDDGPHCEGEVDGYVDQIGMFLSVDGSGMKLERTTSGNTLFMPNGSRYLFPVVSTGAFQESTLYQSNEFIDIDGNRSQFIKDTTTNIRTFKDTLNREVNDFLPQNYIGQEQTEGIQQVDLPTKSGQTSQHYEFKWLRLKPVPDGIQEGALENQNENIYFYGSVICMGAPEPHLYPNAPGNPIPTDIMFPYGGIGLRSCNPGTSVATAKRFNPVVLAEVKLPNGKTYEFKYNQFGEITKITYPTGSYETFTYDRISPLNPSGQAFDQTNRGVTERRVYRKSAGNADVLEQRWQYSATASSGSYKVTTIAPKADDPMGNGIKTERFLQSTHTTETNFGFQNPLEGMPYEERTYDENGKLRSRTLTEYGVQGPVPTNDPLRPANGAAQRDPRPTRSISISYDPPPTVTASSFASIPDPDDEGGGCTSGCGGGTTTTTTIPGNVLASLSSTTYDSGGSSDSEHFSHLNPKTVKKYNLVVIPATIGLTANLTTLASYFTADKLVSISEMDYQYDANYLARGIPSLPTESRLLNPTNPSDILAKSQAVYDETGQYYSMDSGYTSTGYEAPTGANANLRGHPTTKRTWNKDTNTWLETHTQFDNFGNVRKVWDTSGDQTRFIETQYDSLYKYAYPTKVFAPAPDPTGTHGMTTGSEISRIYDFTTGLLTSVTDANGQTATMEYDNLLRPVRSNPPSGGSVSETVYNDVVGDMWVKSRQQIDEQNWAEKTTFIGRVKATSNPYRASDTTKFWSKPKYDELNRVVESYAPAAVSPDDPLQHGASLGTVEFGISTLPDLIGSYVVAKDASGRKSRSISGIYGIMRVDEATNINGSTDNDLGTLASPHQPTSYQYDLLGNLTQVNQSGQTRTFTYDSFSRIKTATNPESGLIKYTYDDFGNLKTKRDARGIKTIYDYDKVGRITTRCYRVVGTGALGATTCDAASSETAEPNSPDVNYFYDGKGLTNTPGFARGHLTKVQSLASETLYTNFDNHGRLLSHQQITDGNTYDTSYKYNLSGALIEEKYPSGKVVRNFLDTDGELSKVVRNGKVYASDFSYTSAGAIENMRLGNGNWESTNYNERFQPIQIGLGNTTNNTTNLWKVNYEYGELNGDGTTVDTAKNIGNIAKQVITVPTVGTNQGFTATQTYSYDALNRLKIAKETIPNQTGWQQTFNYDVFGNRSFNEAATTTLPKLCQEGNQFVVCANDRKILNPIANLGDNKFKTTDDYEYDANGNMTKDAEGKRFTYDALNKQKIVKNASNVTLGTYFYDGEGKRVKKTSSLDNTLFVYDGFGSLIAEYSIDTPQTNPTPNISYLTSDTLGSPRIITGKNGEVLSRRDFLPFGEEIASNENNRKAALGYNYASTTRQAFTGYEKDLESDLEFAQNRYYSNKTGRFTTPDPMMASGNVQDAQSWNRYAYSRNNPINLVDPLGLYYGTKPGEKFVAYFSSLEAMAAAGYTELTDYVYMVGDQIQVFNPGSAPGAVMVRGVEQAAQALRQFGVEAQKIEKLLQGVTAAAIVVAAAVAGASENRCEGAGTICISAKDAEIISNAVSDKARELRDWFKNRGQVNNNSSTSSSAANTSSSSSGGNNGNSGGPNPNKPTTPKISSANEAVNAATDLKGGLKGGKTQGFIKGTDAETVFKDIAQKEGISLKPGQRGFKDSNGNYVGIHEATVMKNGATRGATLDLNIGGNIYKLGFIP
jgi:RHS repeat-associated protein